MTDRRDISNMLDRLEFHYDKKRQDIHLPLLTDKGKAVSVVFTFTTDKHVLVNIKVREK